MAKSTSSMDHHRTSPILSLPIEIIRQVANYLPSTSIASFSLASRFLFHALGSSHLHSYLHSGSQYDYRINVGILERAFSSHWFCAWCGKFHEYSREDGPRKWREEKPRDCAESNGYLHDGDEYVILFHHVRLAIERVAWGEEFGIHTAAFYWTRVRQLSLGKAEASTRIDIQAKVVSTHLLLHSIFVITIPDMDIDTVGWDNAVLDVVPQIIGKHDMATEGTPRLRHALEQAMVEISEPTTRLCPACSTDYRIVCEANTSGDTRRIVMKLESWRDLGNGRFPFDTIWRAHSDAGKTCCSQNKVIAHPPGLSAGQIRQSFEQNKLLIPSMKHTRPAGRNPVARSFDYHFSHDWVQSLYNIRAEIAKNRKSAEGDHERMVAENNERLKATEPLFEPPYGLTWSAFIDLGGMRGKDGIRLSNEEKKQLTSETGLWGGWMKSLNKSLRRDTPESRQQWWKIG